MLKRKLQLTAMILGIFLFIGAILPITVFAQDYEDSPFGFLDVPPDKYDYYNDLGSRWGEFSFESQQLGWGQVERTVGEYDFTKQDEILCKLYNNEQNIIYVTRPINSIYGTISIIDEYPDGYEDNWSDFVRAFVERYDGDSIYGNSINGDPVCVSDIIIKNYQLVHELNKYDKYFDLSDENRQLYATIFEKTYTAMKDVCSDCILFMPVPVLSELSNENNFLSGVLSNLAAMGFKGTDIGFDYHTWSKYEDVAFPEGWMTKGEDYHERKTIINKIKGIAAFYGFNASNIISLESGMAATMDMERDQAAYVIRSYITSLAYGQKKHFWTTTIEYSNYPSDAIFAHTGIVHNPENADGLSHKKLAYYTYKLMIEKLEGSNWDSITTVIDSIDNKYAFKFINESTEKSTYAAWWDYFDDPTYNQGDSSLITLTGISSNQAIVTSAVPNYSSGNYITDYNTAFQIDTLNVSGGSISFYLKKNPVFVEEISNTSIEEAGSIIPNKFQLNQNYPNPFNPTTVISYQLPICSKATLKIYDVLGQEVRTLVNENKSAGYHSVVWNGTDNSGRQVSSGVYFYQLKLDNNFSETKKLLLIK